MLPCVLVTELEYRRGADVFATVQDLDLRVADGEERTLAETILASGTRAVILRHDRYTGPLYQALGRTGRAGGALLARFGVGHEGIDKSLARAHGIFVTNTPGTLDASVAEHVFWLLGQLVKSVARLDARFRAGEFAGQTGQELSGRTMGLLGFGGISRHVARIAHYGFGMRVVACGRRRLDQLAAAASLRPGEFLERCGLAAYTTEADEIFRRADVVSVHLPGDAENRGFVDARRLALLRPGAVLVNTSRGSVMDESAVYDALASGRLAGAGLDVFQAEPYAPAAPDKDLRTLDNVVLTPHTGSNTHQANRRMAQAALANVRAFLDGRWDELTRVD